MEGPSIVIIARPGDTPGLQKLLAHDGAIQVFPDSESLRAIEVIAERPPRIVVLDQAFVATARGAALVARIKAEPHLAAIQVRVLTEDEDHTPTLLAHHTVVAEPAVLKGSLPLEHWGTRDATRIPMSGLLELTVDGNPCQLIDLSHTGAQVVVATRLRPDQRVRMVLRAGATEMRCRAVVAWSNLESAGGTMQYRAGVTFVDPDMATIDALCKRYGTRHDHPPGSSW